MVMVRVMVRANPNPNPSQVLHGADAGVFFVGFTKERTLTLTLTLTP